MDLKQLVTEEFHQGLKEGKEGRITSYTAWGFHREPFTGEEPLREVFVDREDAVTRLARGLGRSVVGAEETVACVGPYGAGVSATLRVVHEALEEGGQVKGVLERASAFMEIREVEDEEGEKYEESYFDAFLQETDFTSVSYIILDDADSVAEYLPKYVDRIREEAGALKAKPAVVVGLHLAGWLSLPSDFRDRISEQIWLAPMRLDDVVEVLRRHLAWARGASGLGPFDQSTIVLVATLSGGLPGAAIGLARRVLRECLTRHVAQANKALVLEVAKAHGYQALEALTSWGLSGDETRTVVITQIVRRPGGVTSSAMADVTSVKRTTINYHLAALEEIGVLVKERRGREVYYLPTGPARGALEILVFRGLHGEEVAHGRRQRPRSKK